MMTRRELNATLGAAFATLLSGAAAPLRAQEATSQHDSHENMNMGSLPPGIKPLTRQAIGDPGDCDVTMAVLNLKPGSASAPHKHSGPVFAYILEGQIENHVDPDEPKTYNAGDFFYEPTLHMHRVMRNLSQTDPAKVLVFQLIPKGQPGGMPAN